MLDLEKAVEYVAENLPAEITMRVTHDEVRLLLRWQITYFRKKGIASYGDIDIEAEMAALRNNVIVTHEDDLVDELIRRSEHSKLDIEVVDIVCITDLVNKYMKEIGAIGDEISKT